MKNEVKIDGGISLLPSVYMTISYGLTNKIALQAYGNRDIASDELFYYQGSVGYYKNFNNNKVFELYGGLGSGYGNAYRDPTGGHLYGRFYSYFTQFNIGKITKSAKNVEYGLGIKTGIFHSNLTDQNFYDWISETGPFITYKDNSLLIEPNLFLRLGGERLKFNIKLSGCWINKFTHTDKWLPYSFINFGLGLNYRL